VGSGLLHLVQRGGNWAGPTSYYSMWYYNCLWSLKGYASGRPIGSLSSEGLRIIISLRDECLMNSNSILIYLRQSRRYMRLPAMSVCLSICLLARLLKNACMDLDEILYIDRCRDMDELIDF